MIPSNCTNSTINNIQNGTTYLNNGTTRAWEAYYPASYLAIFKGDLEIATRFSYEPYTEPIFISNLSHPFTTQYTIYVQYDWWGAHSNHTDYTVQAYSKFDSPVLNSTFEGNVTHMDGQLPSGFTNSTYTGMDGYICNWQVTASSKTEVDLKKVKVDNMWDMILKSDGIFQFFELLWYNPFTLITWF